MRRAREPGAALAALFVVGVFTLNYPLLALFDRDAQVFGVPLPFVHLFAVWALLIAGLAALVERRDGRRDGGDDTEVPPAEQRRRAND